MHSSYDLTMQTRDAGERPFKSFPHHPSAQIPTTFYGGHMSNPFSNSGYMSQTPSSCGMQLPISSAHDLSNGQNLSSCSGGQGLQMSHGSSDPSQGLHGMGLPLMTKSEKMEQDPFGNGSNVSPNASSSSITSGSSPPHSNLGEDLKDDDGSFKMPPKKRPLNVPDTQKDALYWEKRKKNNDSAKRSREARRMKEEQIALRVVYLEQENLQLRTEVSLLKSEIEKLRCMLYNG
ncbi:transcription factor ces-2-like [Haliotis cracherodii]|uniref:transcription factor ces-2-like n=1 Tax=Haliotis cracherodii TaxID=6455 RepID=UPI0039E92C03